nr:PhoX family phosphatase [Stella humosa]
MADRDGPPANSSSEPSIGWLVERRLSRRAVLAGLVAAAALPALPSPPAVAEEAATGFAAIPPGSDDRDHVPAGYRSQVLLRWGDPVLADSPAFAIGAQDAAAQARQFGYNCDFTCYFPLSTAGDSSRHGLLVVNHEYTVPGLMFPGLGADRDAGQRATREQAAIEMAAIGLSVVEVRHGAEGWSVVPGRYARRLTVTTPMHLSGPAAGHARMRTAADPAGRQVAGTFANCAGGQTPWGTVLTGEENFHFFFGGGAAADPAGARYGMSPRSWYSWHRHDARFDRAQEPNEANRFGWIVEFDPYDPASVPVKRTALGRFKHEGATTVVCPDGRLAIYQGDDERFEYVYKFVTARAWNPADRAANRDLLDEGVLHVARFHEDGRLEWLRLVQGEGPLTAANGFPDQATVVIEARRAADLVKATPMDRPEDVEVSPVTGRAYVTMTNNNQRRPEQVTAANPRATNDHGHVIEMIPPDGPGGTDHAATEARWDVLMVSGNPAVDAGTRYGPTAEAGDWLSCPDNLVFDPAGRLWVATDSGMRGGAADGLYVTATTGPERGRARRFYRAPIGAEVTGPCFTPDGRTLFLSVQHPGMTAGSHFAAPSTRWPDFADGMPPRPSVIVITKDDGGPIGG